MTASRRVGILGGTFDPIHIGHVDLGTVAQAQLDLTGLLVVPSHIPPHRPQPRASSFHRFAMVALAVAGRPGWQSSDIELKAGGPSYTTDTIRLLHEDGYQPSELFFIIGADAFAEIVTWKDYPAILERAHFVVVSRPGHPVDRLPTLVPQLAPRMRPTRANQNGEEVRGRGPMILLIEAATADVSATAIRRRYAEGVAVTGMVDARVQQHIEQHRLYTVTSPGRRADEPVDIPAAGRLHGQG